MAADPAIPDEPEVPCVWTVGHSTLGAGDFIGMLQAHRIELVVDVRRFRGSRRHPQFGEQALADSLRDAGMHYVGIDALGGRRRVEAGALHLGWRNSSFRSYAAYTWTDDFAGGLAQLLDLACGLRTAMMCSEVLWWRCHRALISDVLCVLGHEVRHIADGARAAPHPFTSPARLLDGELAYPAEGGTPLQHALPRPRQDDACCAPAR